MKGIIYEYKVHEKYYIGKTFGLERKRIDKHKYEALTKKSDTPFAKAIRKYGWDAVRQGYRVIETWEFDTKKELQQKLTERETFWIIKRNSLVPNGYNVYAKGQSSPPYTANKQEVYKKISDSLKGKYMNSEATSKKIYCIEQDKWYPSISEAERINHISRGSIGKAASGINVKAGGLTWSYDGSIRHRDNLIKASRKRVLCVETGDVFDSIYAAAKFLFGDKASTKKCAIQAAIKRNGTANGLHFKLLDK